MKVVKPEFSIINDGEKTVKKGIFSYNNPGYWKYNMKLLPKGKYKLIVKYDAGPLMKNYEIEDKIEID